eukprot:1189348-Prorocentrum_minimum.AAC.4
MACLIVRISGMDLARATMSQSYGRRGRSISWWPSVSKVGHTEGWRCGGRSSYDYEATLSGRCEGRMGGSNLARGTVEGAESSELFQARYGNESVSGEHTAVPPPFDH